MHPEQQEVEYDIYYQGGPEEFMSLVYPFGPPSGSTFDHLQLKQISYQPLQHGLEMRYQPTSTLINTDKPEKEVVYRSKHIANRSNYFFSTFLPEEGCMVWRSVGCFLQMRPSREQTKQPQKESKDKAISKLDQEIEEMMIKRDGGRLLQRRLKSYDYVREMHKNEPKQELHFVGKDDSANYVVQSIEEAPKSSTKTNWKCSRQEYVRSLST